MGVQGTPRPHVPRRGLRVARARAVGHRDLEFGRGPHGSPTRLTVGALGTLTFNVMGATILRKVRRDPADEPLLAWGTALIAIATVSRVAAAFVPEYSVELLVAAAACWTGAFLVLSWVIARTFLERTERRRTARHA